MYTKPLPRTDQRRVLGYENIAAYQAATHWLYITSEVCVVHKLWRKTLQEYTYVLIS